MLFRSLIPLAGAKAASRLDGTDLRPLMGSAQGTAVSAPGERNLFGEADHNNEQDDITRMVRSGRYKLHYNRLTRASQVFDLSIDPGERTDLVAARPELTRGLCDSGATCVAYETVEDSRGRLPLLAPMSEIAGKIATQAGAFMLEKPLGIRDRKSVV